MTNAKNHLHWAHQLGEALLARHWRCTVAESCTGGSLAAAITEIPGSSQWFDSGFVTYSNRAKHKMLEVSPVIINQHGAVSEEVVLAMSEGALRVSAADLSVAISGVAGPDGGSLEKPVGTVWFAWAGSSLRSEAQCHFFTGNRASIREQAVGVALRGLLSRIK